MRHSVSLPDETSRRELKMQLAAEYKNPLYFLYELLMSLGSIIIAYHSLNISKAKHCNQVGTRYT